MSAPLTRTAFGALVFRALPITLQTGAPPTSSSVASTAFAAISLSAA